MEQVFSSDIEQVLMGGGEVGALIRTIDWAETPVGSPAEWPQSLRTGLSICLASRYPMLIWWGPEMIQFYNDAYRPILGATKHPRSMGQRGWECWAEIWDVIGPMATSVFATGHATWSDDLLLVMDRNRYIEETYFTFSYSPIRDESGGIGGVLVTCIETTARVLSERRLRTLRDLGAQASEGKTAEQAAAIAAGILAHNPIDIPFALLYLLDTHEQEAHLVGTTGVGPGTPISPLVMAIAGSDSEAEAWPLAQVNQTSGAVLVNHLATCFSCVPPGPWPEPPHTALILPIAAQGQNMATGYLVAGLNSRRILDDDYRGFLELIAGHMATAVANARAYEAERQRAEALAELDQAKTTFFNNISHEFRTPLTLLLGPLRDLLNGNLGPLLPQQSETLILAQRNCLRLLKLVNTLLDFSRIEAKRMRASFRPTELATFTAELTSVFRSAVERAGLRLVIDCPPLAEPIYIDQEMWEKIVLNLLSNALKFTHQGEIAVKLRAWPDYVELTVSDTGTGIPADELPHIFERFHRVRDSRARTYEGTGIGLTLVRELVHLHSGNIHVESEVDRGTTFTVHIPTGIAHLPSGQIERLAAAMPNMETAQPYVEEVLHWLPEPELSTAQISPEAQIEVLDGASRADLVTALNVPGARILLVEDNLDMGRYLHRVLAVHWTVELVSNGAAALTAARVNAPDLILSDIMMPGLDGFALLRQLRADPATQTVPVILLSARAGEEAVIEGLLAGADDYLIKPFSAQELLARVGAQLALTRLRQQIKNELAERARLALLRAEVSELLVSNKPRRPVLQGVCEALVSHLDCAFARIWILNSVEDMLELQASAGIYTHLDGEHSRVPMGSFKIGRIAELGKPHLSNDVANDPNVGDPAWAKQEGLVAFAGHPLIVHKRVVGVMALFSRYVLSDNVFSELKPLSQAVGQFLDRKLSEEALQESEARFRNMADNAPVMIWVTELDGTCTYISKTWYEFTGQTPQTALGFGWFEVVHPNDRQITEKSFLEAIKKHQPFRLEYRLRRNDDEYRWMLDSASPRLNSEGEFLGYIGSVIDIHERKEEEKAKRLLAEMRERNRLGQELHDTVAQALGYINLRMGTVLANLSNENRETIITDLQEVKQVIGETYTDVREEIFNLRAKIQSNMSFMELLERYVDKYQRFYHLDIQLVQAADPALFVFPPEVTSQLVRTIQEALINIRKHAHVKTAIIRLAQEDDSLCIIVEDQGQGFDPVEINKKTASFGLSIMRERIESVGGMLRVETALGQGTRVYINYK
ncbi:MAG: PAS domain S-box protein [Anaerolineae bacterium]|nr:PAS domain S-box protein [Anaerolineae bacterium]